MALSYVKIASPNPNRIKIIMTRFRVLPLLLAVFLFSSAIKADSIINLDTTAEPSPQFVHSPELTKEPVTIRVRKKHTQLLTLHSDSTCKLKGKVIKITDGDTVNVLDVINQTLKIRLAGIDAPERGQPFGKAAGKFLASLINQQTVCVNWYKHDKYQRLVGVITHEGEDINLAMITAGYAWHSKKYQHEQSEADRGLYNNAEQQARSDVIGLWSQPDPVTPANWRKGNRPNKSVKVLALVSPENFSCDKKRFCKQMTSCQEAIFYLQQCNLSRLDGDGDGVPCSSKLCKQASDYDIIASHCSGSRCKVGRMSKRSEASGKLRDLKGVFPKE